MFHDYRMYSIAMQRVFSFREQISLVLAMCLLTRFGSSHPEVFLGQGVLKICSNFTGEHLCRSVISIKLQSICWRRILKYYVEERIFNTYTCFLYLFFETCTRNLKEWLHEVKCRSEPACSLIKKEALAQVFSCEFCEISKNSFFTEHLWETSWS